MLQNHHLEDQVGVAEVHNSEAFHKAKSPVVIASAFRTHTEAVATVVAVVVLEVADSDMEIAVVAEACERDHVDLLVGNYKD